MRGATAYQELSDDFLIISIHAPLAGCDTLRVSVAWQRVHFNPRTPCGVRPGRCRYCTCNAHFNPRTPCGVRLFAKFDSYSYFSISIHAPLAGCDSSSTSDSKISSISIHAPHAGCDALIPDLLTITRISIHAPHAGCDLPLFVDVAVECQFQSTHPMRGATLDLCLGGLIGQNFNPRTPCGVRLQDTRTTRAVRGISIHAPHAGCDSSPSFASLYVANFNPRTPCGVRRRYAARTHTSRVISIHAPHAGCDTESKTAPRRTAISIHAPHAGCDTSRTSTAAQGSEFQSTHPMRGATGIASGIGSGLTISIHAPHAGCDRFFPSFFEILLISIHAPHAGCDTCPLSCTSVVSLFQSTHPMRGATDCI